MKRVAGILWVIALAGVIIASTVFVFSGSQPFTSCLLSQSEHENNATSDQHSNQRHANFAVLRAYRVCLGQFVDSNNAEITATATFFLTIITCGLAWIGYRQQVTSRAQLRAYVSVFSDGRIHQQNPPTNPVFEFHVPVKNMGQTPAHRLHYSGGAELFPFPIPRNANLKTKLGPLASTTSLGPGQDKALFCFMPRALTPAEITEAMNPGGRFFHVFGTVRYRDVFGNKRKTDFCFMLVWPTGGGNPYWVNIDRHNSAT